MQLSRMSLGGRLAVTLVLINVLLGLVFAQIEVRYALAGKDGEVGISMNDVRIFFRGDPTRCRLLVMIQGPMNHHLQSLEERQDLEDWVADGAPRDVYDSTIAPLFKERCVSCHGLGGEKASSPLTRYEEVISFVESYDSGISYESLASVSYVHLIAMTSLAALVAVVFYLTRFGGWWKDVLLVLPFAAVFFNVISWWSAKQSDPFLHIIVASSIVYGAVILIMVLVSLADLWILPEASEQTEY